MTKRLIEKCPNLTIWNLVEGRHLFLMAEQPPEEPRNIPLSDLQRLQLQPWYAKIS